MELLGQRGINIPVTRRTETWQMRTRRAKLIGSRVIRIIVGPKTLVTAKGRFESRWIHPLLNLLFSGATSAKVGIPNKVRPAGHLVTNAGILSRNGQRQPALSIEIRSQPPTAKDSIENPFTVEERFTVAKWELI